MNDEPKTWVFEQYDQLVGSRTVRRPGLDAAVLRIDGTRGIAVSLDGPPLGCRDPLEAGCRAVIDAALNVACAGGEPLALTDCLNFGNPEKPEIGWELEQAIEGIAQAAESLRHPGRLRERLALQRDRRPPDPADAGRRLRRPRARRDARSPTAGSRGDRVLLLRGSGAGLVRFVWRHAAAAGRSRTTSPTAASRSRCARPTDWSGAARRRATSSRARA